MKKLSDLIKLEVEKEKEKKMQYCVSEKSIQKLLNAAEKVIANGAQMNSKLSAGGLEMMVEDIGFKNTMNYIKSL